MGHKNTKLLQNKIEEDLPKLFWRVPPFEGPVKLRFFCTICKDEAIIAEPYPQIWEELRSLYGICFKCNQRRKVGVKFIEISSLREPLFTYDSTDKQTLARIISFLSASREKEALSSELSFSCFVHPSNIHSKEFPPSVYWNIDKSTDKDFIRRRNTFYEVANKLLSTEGSQRFVISSRETMLESVRKIFLQQTPEEIRKELTITFANEFAIDLGGVSREFYCEIVQKMLDPSLGFFVAIGPNKTMHPSPLSGANDQHLTYFKFFGRFIAKVLLMGYQVPLHFTRAMFKMMLGRGITIADFQTVDRDLYLQLNSLFQQDPAIIESLELNFTTTLDRFGHTEIHELQANGADVLVTSTNLCRYVATYSIWRMVECVRPQIINFLEGFFDIIPVQMLELFNEAELELLICGVKEINVQDWQRNSRYAGFSGHGQTPKWFWEIMEEFTNEQRSLVLQFATGTTSIIDFSILEPPFALICIGTSDTTLPIAHTCFNRIDLSNYISKELLRKHLLIVLEFGSKGFGIE
eukprot:TRINITY_DN1476_c0_g2_i1.p1 TRINITY_DN1476_c0_g2~~TRINITY_DN1476_c0_g2_i1.p1  ORF type:complete len:523 (-),score=215.30 TRINITY_DN1476_c0_g2_i1:24-1592(-)